MPVAGPQASRPAVGFGTGAQQRPPIVVPGMDQLGPTIDTVIAAVRAGELDELLAQQAKARDVPKAKRAA